jgi:uncharacterized protein (DUF1501 family)
MTMDRRRFLVATLALAASGFSARLMAVPRSAGEGRLLVIFLRGAYDAATALVPVGSDDYYEARPTLAIARPDPANPLAAVRLDEDWGLHPAIAQAAAPLLSAGQLRFVPFVGVPKASRSHFEVQDLIEQGRDGDTSAPRHPDGLLYRLAMRVGIEPAVSFTNTIPTIFRGEEPVANVRLRQKKSRLSEQDRRDIEQLYAGHPLGGMLEKADELREHGDMPSDPNTGGRGAAGAAQLSRHAKVMARYLKRQHRLAFVDLGGWDTHVNQGARDGFLARQLGFLGEGLATFATEMGDAWQHTTVVVMSEFGRTFRENGNGGTDHGHGTVYWLAGGNLPGEKGGSPVRGPRLALTNDTLNEQRDYPVLVDYRALLGEAAAVSFRLPDAELARLFGKAPSRWLRG